MALLFGALRLLSVVRPQIAGKCRQHQVLVHQLSGSCSTLCRAPAKNASKCRCTWFETNAMRTARKQRAQRLLAACKTLALRAYVQHVGG